MQKSFARELMNINWTTETLFFSRRLFVHFPFFESFSNSIREANLKKSEENIMGAYKLKYPTKWEKENLLKV